MGDDIPQEKSKRPLGATILIVIGILWVTLTGLCTSFYLAAPLFDRSTGAVYFVAMIAVPVGALCIAPGIFIWLAGRRMARDAQD